MKILPYTSMLVNAFPHKEEIFLCFFEKRLDKSQKTCYNTTCAKPMGNCVKVARQTLTRFVGVRLPLPQPKKSSFFGTRIFLSKPQAWHIIECITRLWRDIHSYIIKGGEPPLYLISPFGAGFPCGLMIYSQKARYILAFVRMIYNALH